MSESESESSSSSESSEYEDKEEYCQGCGTHEVVAQYESRWVNGCDVYYCADIMCTALAHSVGTKLIQRF